MIKIYFNAFVGTCLLMSIIGALFVVTVYAVLVMFHAPHNIEIAGEIIALIAVLIASIFVFRTTIETERDLANPQ